MAKRPAYACDNCGNHMRVLPESMVYTDEYPVDDKLKAQGYNHKRVHHTMEAWAIGDTHTNTIEGFWSVLKRGINGMYHAVSKKHLQGYINRV
jgi:transposase